MKKVTTTFLALAFGSLSLMAQNYMVIDSKAIFSSDAEYTQAIETLDNMAKEYQAEVDKKFDAVESVYNTYMQRANSLSSGERDAYESKIATMEQEATAYQESKFSNGGELFKKRTELISPIQERILLVIETYAKSKNYDLVLDEASGTTILYKSANVDCTEEIIEQLKK